LERTWREAGKPYERAHVFPYIYEHPESFSLVSVTDEVNRSHMRWTVDTAEDLSFIRALYAKAGNDDAASWRALASIIEKEPALAEINRHVRQKSVEEG